MNNYQLVIFFTLLSIKIAFSQPSQTIVLNNTAELAATKGFLFLSDSAQNLNIYDVLGKNYESKFQPVHDKAWQENIGVYWLRFSVKNETNFDREWVFDFENWSLVDFYYKERSHFYLFLLGLLFRKFVYGI